MLYLTCTMISIVDLAFCGVSHAKDWVTVNCGTNVFSESVAAKDSASFFLRIRVFLFLFIYLFLVVSFVLEFLF